MMKALILFSSREGQTRNIADYIANQLKGRQACEVVDIQDSTAVDWSKYDRVLIGASIHYGRFHPAVTRFIKQNLAQMKERTNGFFSVNLTARKPEKRTPQTNGYTRKFLLQSPWKPDCCAVFAGALRYPHYGFFDRLMIRLIMQMTGGETDTRKEVEYTDWDQVSRFADEFAGLPGKTS